MHLQVVGISIPQLDAGGLEDAFDGVGTREGDSYESLPDEFTEGFVLKENAGHKGPCRGQGQGAAKNSTPRVGFPNKRNGI